MKRRAKRGSAYTHHQPEQLREQPVGDETQRHCWHARVAFNAAPHLTNPPKSHEHRRAALTVELHVMRQTIALPDHAVLGRRGTPCGAVGQLAA